MEKLTENYWNNRYVNADTAWDIGVISEPIKKYVEQIKNKEIKLLIPGAGNAHEAEFLLNNGFKNVYVLDLSGEAIHAFLKRVPTFPAENAIIGDFFEHFGQYDLIVEQTFFCAIDPLLRKNYVSKMHHLLKENGKLIGLLFNTDFNSNNPPYGGNREEYISLFKPFFQLNTIEPAYNSITPRLGRELFINFTKKHKIDLTN